MSGPPVGKGERGSGPWEKGRKWARAGLVREGEKGKAGRAVAGFFGPGFGFCFYFLFLFKQTQNHEFKFEFEFTQALKQLKQCPSMMQQQS